jgi:hypothetical protein
VPNVCAVATDAPLVNAPVPVVHLDDVPAIADHMIAAAVPLEAVVVAPA